jgi:hypothetical protein
MLYTLLTSTKNQYKAAVGFDDQICFDTSTYSGLKYCAKKDHLYIVAYEREQLCKKSLYTVSS